MWVEQTCAQPNAHKRRTTRFAAIPPDSHLSPERTSLLLIALPPASTSFRLVTPKPDEFLNFSVIPANAASSRTACGDDGHFSPVYGVRRFFVSLSLLFLLFTLSSAQQGGKEESSTEGDDNSSQVPPSLDRVCAPTCRRASRYRTPSWRADLGVGHKRSVFASFREQQPLSGVLRAELSIARTRTGSERLKGSGFCVQTGREEWASDRNLPKSCCLHHR